MTGEKSERMEQVWRRMKGGREVADEEMDRRQQRRCRWREGRVVLGG